MHGAPAHSLSSSNSLSQRRAQPSALQHGQQHPTPEKEEKQPQYVYAGLAPDVPRGSFQVRIRGFTFAWFTLCMSMAGFAILLGRIPDAYRCKGIQTLGDIIFVLDLIL